MKITINKIKRKNNEEIKKLIIKLLKFKKQKKNI